MPAELSIERPMLVAHRGYSLRYPENTLLAIDRALEVGASCVEFDVQMSADGVPVLLHDAELRRTAGVDGHVVELTLSALRRIEVSERHRLGPGPEDGTFLPTLQETVGLLTGRPAALAFVDIKTASLDRFGTGPVVERVLLDLQPILDRCTIVSDDRRALALARRHRGLPIGWVIRQWTDESRRAAESLAPEYLVCNRLRVPDEPEPLWPGPWRWSLYDADTPELALELAALGADLVQTRAIAELLGHPRLRGRGRASA